MLQKEVVEEPVGPQPTVTVTKYGEIHDDSGYVPTRPPPPEPPYTMPKASTNIYEPEFGVPVVREQVRDRLTNAWNTSARAHSSCRSCMCA